MIEHSSSPNAQPPFPYNFGHLPRRLSSVPRVDDSLDDMEELGFDQVMAELDTFFGPSPLSSSPAAPHDATNRPVGLKRDSDGDAMLSNALPSAVGMQSTTEDIQHGALRKSPEFAELLENPWMDHAREMVEPEPTTEVVHNAIEEDMSEPPSSTQTLPLPGFGLLIQTTPHPSDVEHLELITHEAEASAPLETSQDLPPTVTDNQGVADNSSLGPDVEQEVPAVTPEDEMADGTQVESAVPSASPPSPQNSRKDQQAPDGTDEVQESPGVSMPMELELPTREERRAPSELDHEVQETSHIRRPTNMEPPALEEHADLTDSQQASPSSEPQLPTYVPSNMMLQAVSEFLPQRTPPLPPTSVHKSEMHAEMRAEEDAADTAISPAPVSTFNDRLHSIPAQPADNGSSSDFSLDQYGNIVFEDEDSDEEAETNQSKPKETSPEDSAIEVVKAPPKRKIQPRKLKIDADKPHWAQLKKPASKKPPPRIKKVPVQNTLPSPSPPPPSGFRSPPELPQRNVLTRASAATNAEATSPPGFQTEETSSSELSSLRNPSPPVAGGFRMPSSHTAAPPPLQYTRVPSTRLQAQQKPKSQPAKKRKPHQNLLASMVPPEFDNTGGSFATPAERDTEIHMNGDDGARASKKRAQSEDEIVYDEEGRIVTAPVKIAAAPPPPKRVKTTSKPKAPPKPPMNKELMSIVGATVMADMHPNSPRKTRNQQRQVDASAPNASAAAKKRHTKQGKLIAG